MLHLTLNSIYCVDNFHLSDEAGVFRAKKQNNSRGAHQVNDSKETRTEKPIDQMEAETVDEVCPNWAQCK